MIIFCKCPQKKQKIAYKRIDEFYLLWYNFRMLNEKLLNKKEVIAVALSGGMDSVCLAHILFFRAKELNVTVKAINVEHGIRGENSLKDSAFVKDFCAEYGIELKCYSVNAPLLSKKEGYSLEQSARILRYECFNNALIEGFCDKIATAHHASDNAETVLFNLFRGSALKGVCGIKESAYDGKIIRPLLNCSKKQIEEYVIKNNLHYVTDETNALNDYTRNYVRNQIIPAIEEKFPTVKQSINRFSFFASKDEELLSALADNLIQDNSVTFTDEISFPLFSRACIKVIKKMGITKDFESSHVLAVFDLKNAQSGKRVNLKNGLVAYRSKNKAVFTFDTDKTDCEIPLTIPLELDFDKYYIKLEKTDCFSPNSLCFDFDKLPYNAIIRTKRTGDEILAFGGKRKSLKKYLTDKKVDSFLSKNMPIIASGNQVYAVLPIDISENLKVDSSTKNIIKITCRRKGD